MRACLDDRADHTLPLKIRERIREKRLSDFTESFADLLSGYDFVRGFAQGQRNRSQICWESRFRPQNKTQQAAYAS